MFPGGGYSEIFPIHRLGLFFGGQNFEFRYFFGFSEKNEYFFGWGNFLDIFGGSNKNLTFVLVFNAEKRVIFSVFQQF